MSFGNESNTYAVTQVNDQDECRLTKQWARSKDMMNSLSAQMEKAKHKQGNGATQ